MLVRCFSFIVVFVVATHVHAISITDSLNIELMRVEADTQKVQLLISLAKEYRQSDNIKAIELLDQAENISKQVNYVSGIAASQYQKAYVYFFMSDFDKAVSEINKSSEIYNSIGNRFGIAQLTALRGSIYVYNFQYDKAMDCFLNAIKVYTEYNYKKGIGICYENMANIYFDQNKFDLTIEYLGKGIAIVREIGTKSELAESYINLVNCYLELGKYKEALNLKDSIIPVFKETKNIEALSEAMFVIGKVYKNLNNLPHAKEYFQNAEYYALQVDSKRVYCLANQNLADVYLLQNKPDSAIGVLTRTIEVAKSLNIEEILYEDYNIMSQAYEKKGNFAAALDYYRKYKTLTDTINEKLSEGKLLKLQTTYEVTLKDEKINLLNKEQEIQRERLSRQRTIIFLSMLSALFLLAMTGLFYNRYRLKRKTAEKLQFQNDKIEGQKVKLEEQAVKLKELDEVKTRFFSNISHEFRTPLTLILGPARQLADASDNKENNETANIIVRNAERLQVLINQLLDLSRIERGSAKLTVGYSDIIAFIRTRVSIFSSLAIEKQIEFTYNISEQTFNAYYDADKLEKIIYNLLSNAFKFTPAYKSIHVSLDFTANRKWISLVVKDTGIGIPALQLPHIFDRFYQAGNQQQYHKEGSGIGLSLVKELVDLYHGSISVESTEGQGTQFTLSLPCDRELFDASEIISEVEVQEEHEFIPTVLSTLSHPTTKANVLKASGSGPLILVVEDNADMRQYIVSNLTGAYRVIEAENGIDGFEMATGEGPDLIISDVMMPGMDGFEFTTKIKQQSETSHIPVILLTAKVAEESKLKGLSCEADEYLTKPFSVKELHARIQNLIRLRKKLRERFSKSIVVNPTEVTTSSLDEQFLQAALRSVERNMDNPEFTAEQLCTETNVSRTNMHRKLKALTDQSATEFIRSVRLKRAAQLLSQQSGSVSEIATKVGFNTLSYFTLCFKEQYNCLPSEYGKS